ncbi:tannase/feruloyl esterase family alpha/beta hydrolase [Mumia sp. zg.B53]|uniref:tannase/feruloyl esterase family alpha/beta hydrolase n=1 Tax=Mumia sp. zg.B53 TaxID=2855449 RepID=UPI001C6F0982|nr:tannase/feruloyl esterase family alpha/beta hydrolase [Mumia sp. zg.B53]MBW9216146.1 tannase/feruloyl esterase family alpha/beta hydrolase [Mumia sp. zg.B53]
MPWSFIPRLRPQRPRGVAVTVAALLTAATLAPVAVATAAPAVGGGGRSAHAGVTPDGLARLKALAPVMGCAEVAELDLTGVTDAPVDITSATVVSAGTPAPYCEVRGTIAPADTIVVRLPVEGWTQRYVQTGCGGLCGNATINYGQAAGCPVLADGSVASATTDMGHQGQNDGSWAAGNPQAQIDFAYRGVHVTAQTAKAIIRAFYGRRPAYSYFTGCSDGGREGLMEAQRYPDDFDGIAAGAPANNMAVQNTFHHAWNVLANKDEDGRFILLADKLPLVHSAVMARCDRRDGVADGVLDDPRACDFDPAVLRCRPGQDTATCLSTAQVRVVRRLHEGATDSRGRRLEPEISHEWGSELEWTLFVPASQGQTPMSENFALSYLRYLAEPNDPRPDFELEDIEFTVPSFWRTVQSSSYMSALDPDLSAFRRGGGKLLLWHGWNDQHISPQSTLAYYDAVQDTLGARRTASFSRLFLFPGLAHCSDGAGPNTFDVLTPVMAWVESGRAPRSIAASRTADGSTRTRPVFPYPTVARYDGTGSTDEARNFVPVTPRRQPGPGYRWVGERLYSSDYQTWCRAVDGRLVCRPSRTWLTRRGDLAR